MSLNSTSAVILGVLHDGPATGGDICHAAHIRLAAQGGVTRSQVYRELPALVDAKLIRLGKNGPRSSQAYIISAAGKRAFARWVAGQNGSDSVRNATVLRMSFGAHLSATQLREIVMTARAEHEATLAEHRQAADALRRTGDTYAAATTDFAVAYERAFLRWLESVPVA